MKARIRKIRQDFKAEHYLKTFLVQITNTIVKSEKYPEYRNKHLN